jgi:hypothetical protein
LAGVSLALVALCGLLVTSAAAGEARGERVSTALVTLRFDEAGTIDVAQVMPKPVRWAAPDAAVPAGAWDESLPRAPKAKHRKVHVVAAAPSGEQACVVLHFEAPSQPNGDVGDPWQGNGALVRLPWLGVGTRYRGVLVSDGPAVSATAWVFQWEEQR